MLGIAEGTNPTLGKAGPLIPPTLGLGTHLQRAPPAEVARAAVRSHPPPRPRALRAGGTLRRSGGRARTAAGSGRGGACSPGGAAALPVGGGDRRVAAAVAAGTGTGGAAWGARGARLGLACSSEAWRPVLVPLGRGSGPAAGLGLGLELRLGPEPRALRPGVAGLALCEEAAWFARGESSAAGEAPRAPGRGEPGRQPAVSRSPLIGAGGAGTAGAAPPGLLLAAPDLSGCSGAGAGAGCH